MKKELFNELLDSFGKLTEKQKKELFSELSSKFQTSQALCLIYGCLIKANPCKTSVMRMQKYLRHKANVNFFLL